MRCGIGLFANLKFRATQRNLVARRLRPSVLHSYQSIRLFRRRWMPVALFDGRGERIRLDRAIMLREKE
jgi:hypothetical protein